MSRLNVNILVISDMVRYHVGRRTEDKDTVDKMNLHEMV